VHIFSCSADRAKSTRGEEGLSGSSATQGSQMMSGEQTGTCGSEPKLKNQIHILLNLASYIKLTS